MVCDARLLLAYANIASLGFPVITIKHLRLRRPQHKFCSIFLRSNPAACTRELCLVSDVIRLSHSLTCTKSILSNSSVVAASSMCAQTLFLYALPCKYHASELEELAATFSSYIERRSNRHGTSLPILVQDLQSAKYVITKLVQTQRLKRELRRLRPKTPVIILQHAWFIQTLERNAELDEVLLKRNAWCIYCPTSQMPREDERCPSLSRDETSTVPQAYQQTGLATQHGSSNVSNCAASLSTGRNNIDQSSAETSSRKPLPALMRRESTTDPTGKSFHGAASGPLSIKKYACQRRTPLQTPNDGLISQFQLMRLARELQCDSVGERAYSTIIASLKAVPIVIGSVNDIEGLEGCGSKTINLIQVTDLQLHLF